MSTTVYGNIRDLKIDEKSVTGLTGSFVTLITGRKPDTLLGGLKGYYRLGHGPAGYVDDNTVIVDHSGKADGNVKIERQAASGSLREKFTGSESKGPWSRCAVDYNGAIRFNKDGPSVAPYSSDFSIQKAGAFLQVNNSALA